MRVGLVLGGGGTVGMAYHAGALAALENDLDWDPRTADIIVGTSAGSIVGSLLRTGVPALDLAALAVGAETLFTPTRISDAVRTRSALPAPRWCSLRHLPRRPSPSIVMNWLRRPWRFDPVAAFVSMMADGDVDLLAHAVDQSSVFGDAWPEASLWICSVRQADLRRVVFGRERTPSLSTAMLASCSIPGYFSPIIVDGEPFIDGGVRSPTNADVLRREDLDLVIILSPMSGIELPRFALSSIVRRYAKRKLAAETATLHRAGIPTVVIEPRADLVELLGNDFMNEDHISEIVTESLLGTGEQLRQPFVRTLLLGGLNGRR